MKKLILIRHGESEWNNLKHVCLTTLWRWNNEKRLRARKMGGRYVMYKYTDVMAFLNG